MAAQTKNIATETDGVTSAYFGKQWKKKNAVETGEQEEGVNSGYYCNVQMQMCNVQKPWGRGGGRAGKRSVRGELTIRLHEGSVGVISIKKM